jgi:hypothetical protein
MHLGITDYEGAYDRLTVFYTRRAHPGRIPVRQGALGADSGNWIKPDAMLYKTSRQTVGLKVHTEFRGDP